MKIYHYTSFSAVAAILGKSRGEISGLEPRKRLGLSSSPTNYSTAIFAFLEPTPDSWVNNINFPITWQILANDLQSKGALLLEIEVSRCKDIFVGERAHLEGILYDDKEKVPSQFLHLNKSEAERAYLKSMLPIDEYLVKKKIEEVQFSLPEVTILSPVLLEAIAVSSVQPLLESSLGRLEGEDREYLVHLINKGWVHSELSVWKRAYEAQYGELTNQGYGKERLR